MRDVFLLLIRERKRGKGEQQFPCALFLIREKRGRKDFNLGVEVVSSSRDTRGEGKKKGKREASSSRRKGKRSLTILSWEPR